METRDDAPAHRVGKPPGGADAEDVLTQFWERGEELCWLAVVLGVQQRHVRLFVLAHEGDLRVPGVAGTQHLEFDLVPAAHEMGTREDQVHVVEYSSGERTGHVTSESDRGRKNAPEGIPHRSRRSAPLWMRRSGP